MCMDGLATHSLRSGILRSVCLEVPLNCRWGLTDSKQQNPTSSTMVLLFMGCVHNIHARSA